MHCLPGGACVIDTPDLRRLRLDADEATLGASFDEIEGLAAQCRFRDCGHRGEPGCAARAGVEADRLRNDQKLLRKARRDSLNPRERQQQLAMWKSRTKSTRSWTKLKRGEVP